MEIHDQVRLLYQLQEHEGWKLLSAYLKQQALELNNKVLLQLISKDAEDVQEAVINAQRVFIYNQVQDIQWLINQIKESEVASDAQE